MGHASRILPEDAPEITILTHLLNRALIVDLHRSQQLGGGIVDIKVPWCYVILEDFEVFRGVELAPASESLEDWRDLSLWSVQPEMRAAPAAAMDGWCNDGWCMGCKDNGWTVLSWYGTLSAPGTQRARMQRSRQMGFSNF